MISTRKMLRHRNPNPSVDNFQFVCTPSLKTKRSTYSEFFQYFSCFSLLSLHLASTFLPQGWLRESKLKETGTNTSKYWEYLYVLYVKILLSSIQNIINQVHSFHKSCWEKANRKQIQANSMSIWMLLSCISNCFCLVFKLVSQQVHSLYKSCWEKANKVRQELTRLLVQRNTSWVS